jgi:hypothetical protein
MRGLSFSVLGVAVAIGGGFPTSALASALQPQENQAREISDASRDGVTLMLEAINQIRSAKDIKLDCTKYVDAYLGRGESIKHYIDAFGARKIRPIKKFIGPKHFTYFDIGYSTLKDVKNSRFGKQDVIVVAFITENESDDSSIKSCSASLNAAPGMP